MASIFIQTSLFPNFLRLHRASCFRASVLASRADFRAAIYLLVDRLVDLLVNLLGRLLGDYLGICLVHLFPICLLPIRSSAK